MNFVYHITTAVDTVSKSSTSNSDSHIILIAWIVIMFGALFLDILRPKPVSMWYSVGAFFAIIAKLLGLALGWQFLIYAVTSFLALIVISYKINTKATTKMNAAAIYGNNEEKNVFKMEELIGKEGIVIKTVGPQKRKLGLVKIWGIILPAESTRGQKIDPGTFVKIKAIRTQELGGIAQFFGGVNSMKYVLVVTPIEDRYSQKSGGDNGSRIS